MGHEDGGAGVGVLAGLLDLLGEAAAEDEPAAEAQDAGEAVRGGQAGEEGHGAALAEAAEDDAVGGDAGVDLGLDELVEVLGRLAHAGLVFVCADGFDGAV